MKVFMKLKYWRYVSFLKEWKHILCYICSAYRTALIIESSYEQHSYCNKEPTCNQCLDVPGAFGGPETRN